MDLYSVWLTITGALGYTPENVANKDATGGYAGLTLFKINFKNVANTFTSFFTNTNTAARTYTFQDRNGTIADDTDLALKAPLAAPTLTGIVTGGSRIKYGTNAESLSGNKSIVSATDVQVQLLNPNGANRDVTLYASPVLGDAFVFKNTGSAGNNLVLKNNAGTTLITIANNVAAGVIYDGSAWQLV